MRICLLVTCNYWSLIIPLDKFKPISTGHSFKYLRAIINTVLVACCNTVLWSCYFFGRKSRLWQSSEALMSSMSINSWLKSETEVLFKQVGFLRLVTALQHSRHAVLPWSWFNCIFWCILLTPGFESKKGVYKERWISTYPVLLVLDAHFSNLLSELYSEFMVRCFGLGPHLFVALILSNSLAFFPQNLLAWGHHPAVIFLAASTCSSYFFSADFPVFC